MDGLLGRSRVEKVGVGVGDVQDLALLSVLVDLDRGSFSPFPSPSFSLGGSEGTKLLPNPVHEAAAEDAISVPSVERFLDSNLMTGG